MGFVGGEKGEHYNTSRARAYLSSLHKERSQRAYIFLEREWRIGSHTQYTPRSIGVTDKNYSYVSLLFVFFIQTQHTHNIYIYTKQNTATTKKRGVVLLNERGN